MTLTDLHDGFFDGVWLSADRGARFFVRTVAGERSTIILTDIEALNICGLRAGNIIFDLVLIAPVRCLSRIACPGLRLEKWRSRQGAATSWQSARAGPLRARNQPLVWGRGYCAIYGRSYCRGARSGIRPGILDE